MHSEPIMKGTTLLLLALVIAQLGASCVRGKDATPTGHTDRFPYRGWNILSSHRENGLKTLDKAVEYGVNHIELSHYQLCHNLQDLRKLENREATKLFAGGDTLQELRNLCPGIYMTGLDDPKTYYFTGGGSVLAAIEQGSPYRMKPFEVLLEKENS